MGNLLDDVKKEYNKTDKLCKQIENKSENKYNNTNININDVDIMKGIDTFLFDPKLRK